ncbi:hypothetical protein V565_350030, partial [Rhizoctonia solani 123E]
PLTKSPLPHGQSPLPNHCNTPSSSIHASLTPEPILPQGQHFSPSCYLSPPVQQPSPEPPLDDNCVGTPSPEPPQRTRRHASPEDLPGLNPNDRHEHCFDQLLPHQHFIDLDVEDELLDLGKDEEDDAEEDKMFDEYGLPRDADEPPGEQQQPFVLPWENQPDNGPDPDPNHYGDIDPGECCSAFQEHPLIRNTYIDAVVEMSHG